MSTIEQVLVVPRNDLLSGKSIPNGFSKDGLPDLIKNIYNHAYFIERPKAETDSGLKQIIPYVVVAGKSGKIFSLRRKTAQTEKRLHNKSSIGVGGHINPDGKSGENISGIIERSLERELHEELSVKCPYKYTLIGYLNDDSNDVGSVHFGLVYRLEVADEAKVEVNEKDLMQGEFLELSVIESNYPAMETWSQLVFKAIKN
jgi:predicted NUDIX family phosphoesterase